MFGRNSFEQRLLLNDGYFKYTGKDYTIAKIWVDIFNPVVHVDMNGLEKIIVQVAYGNWHYEDRPIIKQERDQGSWGIYTSKTANGTTYANKIAIHENGVFVSHRNKRLHLWNSQMKQQRLQNYSFQCRASRKGLPGY
ncbi:hypothetical protein ACHAPI_011543 [Fusarium lateritium]